MLTSPLQPMFLGNEFLSLNPIAGIHFDKYSKDALFNCNKFRPPRMQSAMTTVFCWIVRTTSRDKIVPLVVRLSKTATQIYYQLNRIKEAYFSSNNHAAGLSGSLLPKTDPGFLKISTLSPPARPRGQAEAQTEKKAVSPSKD